MLSVEDDIVLRERAGKGQTQRFSLVQVQLAAVAQEVSSVADALSKVIETPRSVAGEPVVGDSRCQFLHLSQLSKNEGSILVSNKTAAEGKIGSELLVGESGSCVGDRFSVFAFDSECVDSLVAAVEVGVDQVVVSLLEVDRDGATLIQLLFAAVDLLNLDFQVNAHARQVALDRQTQHEILRILKDDVLLGY